MQWKKSGELVVIFISGHRNCEPCSKKEKVHLFSTVHKLNCFVASGQSQSHTEHTGNPLLHASEDGMSTEGAQLSLHIKHTWSTTYIVCPGKKVIWQGCAFQRPCICKDNFYVFWCFCLFFFFPFSNSVRSAIETSEQKNDLVMHTLYNLNKRGSVINVFSDLFIKRSYFKGKHWNGIRVHERMQLLLY